MNRPEWIPPQPHTSGMCVDPWCQEGCSEIRSRLLAGSKPATDKTMPEWNVKGATLLEREREKETIYSGPGLTVDPVYGPWKRRWQSWLALLGLGIVLLLSGCHHECKNQVFFREFEGRVWMSTNGHSWIEVLDRRQVGRDAR